MLFLAFFGFLLTALAHDFSVCKNHQDGMGVESITFIPDPPQSGKLLTVSVSGHSKVALEDGTLEVSFKVYGIVVSTETFQVCEFLTCPVSAGSEYQGKFSQEIPAGLPSKVTATVRITLVNKKKETLTCLEGSVSLGDSHSFSGLTSSNNELLFQKWKIQYPHVKPNFEVFVENLMKVYKHNSAETKSFTMAMNEFGSMTEEEFVKTRMGLRRDLKKTKPIDSSIPRYTYLRKDVAYADPPAELDWRTKGVVAEVKNQGACGSCWAFSAVGSLESAYAIKTGNLIEFSEQELVSCDMTDYGCSGGWMDNAFEFVERSGICKEADYGYTSGSTSMRGDCDSTCTPVEDSIPKGFVDVPPNEAALMAALVEHGPVSVAIEADQSAFQFYHSGVLNGDCGHHLDHGVLLVGFGVDEATELPYWIVKNSWGSGWGESGYVRILRGQRYPSGSECGISDHASYPLY